MKYVKLTGLLLLWVAAYVAYAISGFKLGSWIGEKLVDILYE